jgi:quercetin dioxygenase-like cupin family protein
MPGEEVVMDAALIEVIPWNRDEAPTESNIMRQFEQEGLAVCCWSNTAGYYYDAHTHAFHKILSVIEGEITFSLPELDQEVTLKPGDRLVISPGVLHHAFVGPEGVCCVEGKRRCSQRAAA